MQNLKQTLIRAAEISDAVESPPVSPVESRPDTTASPGPASSAPGCPYSGSNGSSPGTTAPRASASSQTDSSSGTTSPPRHSESARTGLPPRTSESARTGSPPTTNEAARTASPRPTSESARTSGVLRGLYISLGVLCVAIGAIGAFVPGLPTTVFLLVASFFFARSSPRLQRWLLGRPILGESLRRIARGERAPLRTRLVSLFSMWTMIALTLVIGAATLPSWVAPTLVVAGLIGTYYLTLWSPSQRPARPCPIRPERADFGDHPDLLAEPAPSHPDSSKEFATELPGQAGADIVSQRS